MTLRLDAGAAEVIAGGHDDAAAKIDEAAPTAPTKVDAGYGAEHIANILAAVSETAGEIALINTGIAALVRDCADDLGLTEQAIAAEFDRMGRLA